MKIKRILLFSLTLIISSSTASRLSSAVTTQSGTVYQQMTLAQRAGFVTEKAHEISRKISGNDYEFTTAFEMEIQKAVDMYARRIGNNAGDSPGKGDVRIVFERGQTVAPVLIKTFKAHNVSPLIGLYLPLVESEYVNIDSPNSVGAVGMFQFVPQTGEHYGLSADDLLDVEKSADAAARYIGDGIKQFGSDRMKEALALLAYNRGGGNVERDLATLVNEQNRACSICALTEQRDKLDKTFRSENVYYVPRWFAAAIIGENPQAFGLQTRPLSSFESK
ncbi:MAG TPA: transglycosylase SLT domain-containing protein [Pyrinomonadaceae bacterium]|nr:transglycosylase SLT domain-containing protein [Pyrinomonadaceae bacterium]